MSFRIQLIALLALFTVIAASSALAGGGQPFKVTSTLDGKTVLPHRIHWLAHPRLPTSRITEVDFLIDGKVRWIEHGAPYVYGGDHDGHNQGYLITTWLAPGKHRFTARVTDTDGRNATRTVVARVLTAPEPPAKLKGEWTRIVTDDDLKKSDPAFGGGPPAGTWKLVFDRVGAWHLDPLGSGVVNQYEATPGVIRVYSPIAMAPEGVGISRFGHHGIGPLDCTPAGPSGSYRWSVSGNELTLAAIKEGCGQRRVIWEGSWTRLP
jgi:hypothetical protein